MNIKTLGIDLAKTTFQLHGINELGKAILRKKVNRKELVLFMVNLPRCTVYKEP